MPEDQMMALKHGVGLRIVLSRINSSSYPVTGVRHDFATPTRTESVEQFGFRWRRVDQ